MAQLELILVAAASVLAGAASGAAAAYLLCKRCRGAALAVEAVTAAAARERLLVRLRRRIKRKPSKRYIVFEVVGGPVEPKDLEDAIREAFARLFGEPALGVSMLRLVEYHDDRMVGILRVRREYKYHALAALGLVRSISGRRVLLVPVLTSGTLKRARRRAGLA